MRAPSTFLPELMEITIGSARGFNSDSLYQPQRGGTVYWRRNGNWSLIPTLAQVKVKEEETFGVKDWERVVVYFHLLSQ